MRRAGLLAIVLAIGAAPAVADPQSFEQVERGRYLTVVGDCAACHDGPGNGKPFAGGKPLETPFGTLLGPNITPDRETGIGAWSDEAFDAALRRGLGAGGKHLYPGMPYPYFTHVTPADVRAIRAYLNTVTPVRHKVEANQLPFPFDVRISMTAWNALYFREGVFQPIAGKSADWNRGAYLVTGLGHCGACHTPKTDLGGDETSHALQGYAVQGWFAPDITGDDRVGLGRWTVPEIVAYLRSGHNQVAAAGGPMSEEVMRSSSRMSEADLTAIAVYLKDQPGRGSRATTALDPSDRRMQAGAAIYVDQCSACHARDGGGVPGLLPRLQGAASVQQSDPASLLHVLLIGAATAATDAAPTGPGMPGYGHVLDDAQIAAVATYVRNAWGNAAAPVSASDSHAARAKLLPSGR